MTIRSPEIRALALIRHLIAHKNGVVVDIFLRQLSEPPSITLFSEFSENNPVLFTGNRGRSLVDPVTVLAYELIQFIDDWLQDHKPA